MRTQGCRVKSYDYLLKSLLVGDSDVSNSEILENLQHRTAEYRVHLQQRNKTTTILLELGDNLGQGSFCTIVRSYPRGCKGFSWSMTLISAGPSISWTGRSDIHKHVQGGEGREGSGVREVSLDPGWESAAPGLQAASPHRAGAHLREEELHDLVRTLCIESFYAPEFFVVLVQHRMEIRRPTECSACRTSAAGPSSPAPLCISSTSSHSSSPSRATSGPPP